MSRVVLDISASKNGIVSKGEDFTYPAGSLQINTSVKSPINDCSIYFDDMTKYKSNFESNSFDFSKADNGSLTIAFWFMLPKFASYHTFAFEFDTSTSNIYGIILRDGFTHSDNIGIRINSGFAGDCITSSINTQLNTWTHFCFCIDGTYAYLFINGNLTATKSVDELSNGSGNYAKTWKMMRKTDDKAFVPLYIDNLGVVEGACYSTKSFTPSIIDFKSIQSQIVPNSKNKILLY